MCLQSRMLSGADRNRAPCELPFKEIPQNCLVLRETSETLDAWDKKFKPRTILATPLESESLSRCTHK